MIFHNNKLVGIGAMKLAAPRHVHEMQTDPLHGKTHVLEWREYFPNGVGYVYTHRIGPFPQTSKVELAYPHKNPRKKVTMNYVDGLLGYVWVPAEIAALVDKDNLDAAPGGITWSEDLGDGHVFGFDRVQDAMENDVFGCPKEWDIERVKGAVHKLYDEMMTKARDAADV